MDYGLRTLSSIFENICGGLTKAWKKLEGIHFAIAISRQNKCLTHSSTRSSGGGDMINHMILHETQTLPLPTPSSAALDST